jgi:hypothetical protein
MSSTEALFMETTPYASRLRFLDANDVDAAVVDYDGLDVHGPDGDRIGRVDGFVIDPDARRVYYVVIDSGGWFTSQRLLLPIGHASLATDRKSLQTDVTRDVLSRLPELDEDRFRRFTDDELKTFERDTVVACCPDEPLEEVSSTDWTYDRRHHYRQPSWWPEKPYSPDRLRAISRSVFGGSTRPPAPSSATPSVPVSDLHNRELVVGREDSGGEDPGRSER